MSVSDNTQPIAAIVDPSPLPQQATAAVAVLPGLVLTGTVAAGAFWLHDLPGLALFSPMILAIFVGIACHNLVGTPSFAAPGVKFSLRRILRFAIILLGLQLTAQQVAAVGVTGGMIVVSTLIATFLFTSWAGRLIGVDRKLSQLIAAGTSICGASAVIATNTVTGASDEDVAYAVACVTVFGSLGMFVYPLFPGLLHLSAHAYGLWAGSSIHEIAQVVAAAYQDGHQAGDFATIAKLTRVMMLAPVVVSLGLLARGGIGTADGANIEGRSNAVPLPWFVLGFIALVGVNSLIVIPAQPKAAIATATTFLLSVSLAAMGLETDISKLRRKGFRPLLLGLAASAFISLFSLALIHLV
jgi:uncharacterized integral membrane protein (TIGR00698 family)